jgi:cytidylate kinase
MYNEDLLIKYMVESFNQHQPLPEQEKSPGPFITISRDFGCQANLLASMLQEELRKQKQEWTILNKEIISESAKKLGMEPRHVINISVGHERTHMDEVLRAISTKYYKTDQQVRKTIASVVEGAARKGNVIIVGRAGAAITLEIQPSLHIKLYAPTEWRITSLVSRFHALRENMAKEVAKTDRQRSRLTQMALKENMDVNNIYDLQINCSKVSHKQIIEMIIALMKDRFNSVV